MIYQVLWQQTVLMWARWWIEHPVQHQLFRVLSLLYKANLIVTLGLMMIPVATFLWWWVAAGISLGIWAAFYLIWKAYTGLFVKPAFVSYFRLPAQRQEDLHHGRPAACAYLAGLRDLWARLALRFPLLG